MAKRKGKVATAADWAALNFEPVPAETMEKLQSVSKEDWLKHLWTIRAAFVVLSKTKEELKALARKASEESTVDSIELFDQSIISSTQA
jgi:hypothetical protein